ncbi:MAG TPA: cytochrome c peroxidase [Hyphomicrobiaceae bacterium]|nr:cytochrome c peroxidase [Hyphomicrobiaceae bacterium]
MAWLASVLGPLRRPWAALVVSAILSFAALAALYPGRERAEARSEAQAGAQAGVKKSSRRGGDPLETLKAQFGRPGYLPSPAANRPTAAKVALGQRLFFDKEFSATGTIACASCHDPKLAFTDGEVTGRGVSGRRLVRHTPTLWNLAWSRLLFWDGRAPSLEAQVRFPVEHPDEMGDSLENAVSRLSRHDSYERAFAAAFPSDPQINPGNLSLALAAYERTLVSPPTRFDTWIGGDRAALSAPEIRGFRIFTGKGRCSNCHTGFALTDNNFYDIGLPGEDPGRGAVIALPAADHAFKTPTLRELAWTAPYMHDGSLATLEDVLRHYETGGVARLTRSRDLPQDLRLSDGERADLIAFLETLSSDRPPQPSQEPWVGNAEPATLPAAAAARRVSQADKKFAPAHVRLKAGETLTVLNDDTRTHNVRIYDPRFDFNSGAQEPREAVIIRFPVTGTFEAFCGIHPSMRLTVEVE